MTLCDSGRVREAVIREKTASSRVLWGCSGIYITHSSPSLPPPLGSYKLKAMTDSSGPEVAVDNQTCPGSASRGRLSPWASKTETRLACWAKAVGLALGGSSCELNDEEIIL